MENVPAIDFLCIDDDNSRNVFRIIGGVFYKGFCWNILERSKTHEYNNVYHGIYANRGSVPFVYDRKKR